MTENMGDRFSGDAAVVRGDREVAADHRGAEPRSRVEAAGSPQRALIEAFDAVVACDPGVDRFEVFKGLRQELPVFFSSRLDSFVVSRYEDVRAILADGKRFEPPKDGPGSSAFGRTFLHMGGREHTKKVGIVTRRIRNPRAFVERLDRQVASIASACAERLPFGVPVDLKEDYAMWIPLLAIAELTAVHEANRFRDWYRAIVAGGVSSITDPSVRDAAFRARDELHRYFLPIIRERRRSPGDDLVSDLATAEYDGDLLPEGEVAACVVFLLAAGIETTERVLASAFTHFATHPEQWSRLRARRDDVEFLSAVAAESLRCFPPVSGTTRRALVDVEVEGSAIAAGERVVVLIASANRDETRFEDPDLVDFDRFAENPGVQFMPAGAVLPFGAGSHYCAGAQLAHAEIVHALSELARRVETIEPSGALAPAEGFMLHSPSAVCVVLGAAREADRTGRI